MSDKHRSARSLEDLDSAALTELAHVVEDIDNGYRAVAEKVGALYLRADEQQLSDLTAQLDKPMRNASENEQAFAALLDELRVQRRRRQPAGQPDREV
ncbi:MAG: hypothetical protein ABIR52_05390 [Casimicrobiaceae bacterium]